MFSQTNPELSQQNAFNVLERWVAYSHEDSIASTKKGLSVYTKQDDRTKLCKDTEDLANYLKGKNNRIYNLSEKIFEIIGNLNNEEKKELIWWVTKNSIKISEGKIEGLFKPLDHLIRVIIKDRSDKTSKDLAFLASYLIQSIENDKTDYFSKMPKVIERLITSELDFEEQNIVSKTSKLHEKRIKESFQNENFEKLRSSKEPLITLGIKSLKEVVSFIGRENASKLLCLDLTGQPMQNLNSLRLFKNLKVLILDNDYPPHEISNIGNICKYLCALAIMDNRYDFLDKDGDLKNPITFDLTSFQNLEVIRIEGCPSCEELMIKKSSVYDAIYIRFCSQLATISLIDDEEFSNDFYNELKHKDSETQFVDGIYYFDEKIFQGTTSLDKLEISDLI